jgi:hypothetical protein
MAVRAVGLSPAQAVALRGGAGAAFMGWPEPAPDVQGLHGRWEAAESATDDLVARSLGVLDDDEVAELVDLSARLLA